MSEAWYRIDEKRGTLTLTLHVQPNAAATRVAGLHGDALKVLVAAPAVDNKANAKLLRFLSEAFEVAANRVTLKQGEHGRRKIIEIAGTTVAPETLLSKT
jgi:uncharacterized protein (TIGR00251 family)